MALRTVYLLATIMLMLSAGASASLVPTSFGFPVLSQFESASMFSRDDVASNDIEDMSIHFPVSEAIAAGATVNGMTWDYPMISQDSIKTQSFAHADFAQHGQVVRYSYPFVAVNSDYLPGFNFGF
jgi:hypothetical protein